MCTWTGYPIGLESASSRVEMPRAGKSSGLSVKHSSQLASLSESGPTGGHNTSIAKSPLSQALGCGSCISHPLLFPELNERAEAAVKFTKNLKAKATSAGCIDDEEWSENYWSCATLPEWMVAHLQRSLLAILPGHGSPPI